MLDFLKACYQEGHYTCDEHPHGKIKSGSVSSGTPSALCCYGEDDDGRVLKHSFNPLAKWFLLRDVTVPDVYKNIWGKFTEKYEPPSGITITVKPCPERYVTIRGKRNESYLTPTVPILTCPSRPIVLLILRKG